jgi:hypothetical protein
MLPPSLNESVRQERSGVLQVKPYERCVGGGLLTANGFNVQQFHCVGLCRRLEGRRK